MNRVLLKDASIEDEETQKIESKLEKNHLKVTKTYGQALNLFLPPDKTPPRNVNEDDEIVLQEIINLPDQNFIETDELTESLDQYS